MSAICRLTCPICCCFGAGLHITYPKDKKAALRADDILAFQRIESSDAEYDSLTSSREHPDDVVSAA